MVKKAPQNEQTFKFTYTLIALRFWRETWNALLLWQMETAAAETGTFKMMSWKNNGAIKNEKRILRLII